MVFFEIKDYQYELYDESYTWRDWVQSGDQGSEDFSIRRNVVKWTPQSEEVLYVDGTNVSADDLIMDWINEFAVEEEPAPEVPEIKDYVAGEGITISVDNVISNSGVCSVSTGTLDGHIMVNKNGTDSNVKVKGLKSAAYKDASDFAPAYSYSTTDLVEGSSSLTTGKIYFVYE